jgi:hypothetical protein
MYSSRRQLRIAGLGTGLLLALTACGTTVSGAGNLSAAPGAGMVPAANGPTSDGRPGSATTGTSTGLELPGSGSPTAPGAPSALAPTTGAPNSLGAPVVRPQDRVTTPITIGVLAAGDTQAGAKTAGADSGTSVSAETTLKALMRHFKAGIAGRPLRTVYKAVPTTTTNYQSELAADCALFTQDNHVDVVLSDIGYYADNLTACLDHAHVPQIEGGWGLTDDATFRKYPGYFTPGFPSYDTRFGTLVAAGLRSGALKRGMKVGVMVESCPFIQAAYRAQLLPRARAAGLVVDEAQVQCTTGFQDAGAIAQQAQAAAFRFQANGDQVVMFATYPTAVDLLFFSQNASTQQYHPTYWLDSLAEAVVASDAGQYPKNQVQNMRGVGWISAMDISSPRFTRPEQKRCIDVMRSQGVALTRQADYVIAFTACDAFFLLEAALKRTGGQSGYSVLGAGIESLGSGFAASALTGRTLFRAGRHYGPQEFSTFTYDGSCDCFRYTSDPRAWM